MTAQCGKVFPGQGNVQVAPLLADGAVQADDLAVLPPMDRMFTPLASPAPCFRDAAHGGKAPLPRRNVLFLSEFPDRKKQIVPPAETDAVQTKRRMWSQWDASSVIHQLSHVPALFLTEGIALFCVTESDHQPHR